MIKQDLGHSLWPDQKIGGVGLEIVVVGFVPILLMIFAVFNHRRTRPTLWNDWGGWF